MGGEEEIDEHAKNNERVWSIVLAGGDGERLKLIRHSGRGPCGTYG